MAPFVSDNLEIKIYMVFSHSLFFHPSADCTLLPLKSVWPPSSIRKVMLEMFEILHEYFKYN